MKMRAFHVTYPGFTLTAPQLTLEKGKVYALIGANGSGKSSFLKALAGAVKTDVPPLDKTVRVEYLPQKPYIFRMSAEKNILLGNKDPRKALEWMKALGIEHLSQKNCRTLSGGETARVALARALMGSCDLLLLDEPAAALDMEAAIQAEAAIGAASNNHCTLLVTHSPAQAERMADYVLFFSKGELREWGTAAELFHNPGEPETKRFLAFAK